MRFRTVQFTVAPLIINKIKAPSIAFIRNFNTINE